MKIIGTRVQQIDLVISANTDDYNVFTSAGSPTGIVNLTLTVNAGVVVRDTDGVSGGINFGTGWVAGSTFRLNNSGDLRGLGGTGGNGATGYGVNGSPGTGGSEAIRLQGLNVTIDNTNGTIFGAGGGGGGGGGGRSRVTAPGGTGGGGSPPAGNGGSGTESGAGGGGASGGSLGLGGAGGGGGDWGTAGYDGGDGGSGMSGGAGGTAGKAIRTDGGIVTWLGGDNPSQRKGAVS